MIDDVVIIPNDVYNITVAANMSKRCPKLQLNLSIKYCVLVFIA